MEVAMLADEGAFIGGVALTMTAITLLVSNWPSTAPAAAGRTSSSRANSAGISLFEGCFAGW
jgi:hypothetical protein